MSSETKPFGDTLIKGAFARMNAIQFPEDAAEVEAHGYPAQFAGKYAVTFNHSDGGESILIVADDPTPCEVFMAGAFFITKKINRWVEKGDIKIA